MSMTSSQAGMTVRGELLDRIKLGFYVGTELRVLGLILIKISHGIFKLQAKASKLCCGI